MSHTYVSHAEMRLHCFKVIGQVRTTRASIGDLVLTFNHMASACGFPQLRIAAPRRREQLADLMLHTIRRLDAMPEYANPVPPVSAESRVQHERSAYHLRGILDSHGIAHQDFDAVLGYLLNTPGAQTVVPRYWVKIYVDYIYE